MSAEQEETPETAAVEEPPPPEESTGSETPQLQEPSEEDEQGSNKDDDSIPIQATPVPAPAPAPVPAPVAAPAPVPAPPAPAPVLLPDKQESSTKQAAAARATAAANSTIYTIDKTTRSATHNKLRAYEARRRSAYTSKLESSSLYWRSFRDLLHASVHETARAERLVLGSVKVNQTYADAMKATYDDVFLDDKGNPVTDPKKQKKLHDHRTQPSSSPGPHKSSGGSGIQRFTGGTDDDQKSGMLSSLIESQCTIAEQFGENAKHVSAEIVTEVTVLRQELQNQVKDLEKLGDAIVTELELAEREVEETWDDYYSMAMKVLGGNGSHTIGGGGSRPNGIAPTTPGETDLAPSNTTTTSVENCNDVWVVEMRYRVAVAYQSMAWEKGSTELSKLFASMKEAECQRRVKLREVLIAFLNRQERLFLSLPSIQTPVLKDLVSRQMDRDTIEQNVQDSIRTRAQQLQREQAKQQSQLTNNNNTTHTGSSATPNATNGATKKDGPGLSTAKESEGDFTLDSPLMSELLCKTKVLEVKRSGIMSTWKTALAVVTADSFLHLFDMPSTKVVVQSGSAPEVAFHALVPVVQTPTAESIIKGGRLQFVKTWNEHLSPAESLVLPNCTIAPGAGSDTSTFEITEVLKSKGAWKLSGKTTQRKLMIRTVTREETMEWITALKAQK